MICLFNNKATKEQLMTTNGDYILDPICTKSIISEKINEDYSCQFSFKLNKDYSGEINALIEDAIIRVEDEEGEENFRIVNITKTTNYIEVFAVHITIRDIINMWLEDVRPTNQSGQGALTWIFDNAEGGSVFNVTSNISDLNTSYYENMNVYNALYGAENSFINKWGGETRRRGFNIAINDKIGIDRDMQIRSKKNLTGFEVKTNLDTLCTTLYVKGFDGIKLNSPVISPLINNYSKPFYKEIKYEDIKVKNTNNPSEGYDTLLLAQAEMQRRSELEYSKNNIDKIQATYTIKFAQLEKTEEYKNYSMIEKAFLGDTVSVLEDNYNINISVRVVARSFNVLKQERVETTLSNVDIKTKPVKVEDILKQLEKGKETNGQADLSSYIDSMMKSGIKDSYVIIKENELLIMDSKDINTAINVCRYNKLGMGFSQDGYFGSYQYGFTIDGKINADMITVGTLSANLIKAGILKSFNDLTWINMDNGTFNFADKVKFENNIFEINNGTNFKIDSEGLKHYTATGIKSVEVLNNQVKVYDWELNGDFIGSMYAGRSPGKNYGYMCLYGDVGNPLYLGSGTKTGMIICDNADQKTPVTFIEEINTSNHIDMLGPASIAFYGADYPTKVGIIQSITNRDLWIASRELLGSVNIGRMSPDGLVYCNTLQVAKEAVAIWGSLTVTGAKNRAVDTKFGLTTQNAYETAEPLFGDVGEGIIGEDGLCYIFIDPVMLETINTKCGYQVFLQKYGEGECYPTERTENYFIIKGTPSLKFAWELKAHQRGYENDRLEIIEPLGLENDYISAMEEPKDDINYEENAITYLNEYRKEIETI